MKICVIGWYGTETLGDRAIFDGIVSLFQKVDGNNEYYVGSLYPFLTERTFFEDSTILHSHGGTAYFSCFDIKIRKDFVSFLEQSDILIMGGGPLMDIQEMYFIESAFKLAKKRCVPTMLFGCGFGPIASAEYSMCCKKILKYSDVIIMRSNKCRTLISKYTNKNVYSLCDPAIISVINYKKERKRNLKKENCLLINYRDLAYVYPGLKFDNSFLTFLNKWSRYFKEIVLYPMHTFSVGGDDRAVENKLLMETGLTYINVINKPLSLVECYDLISESTCCIGMRYHSIIFQTILNGNNYIIDYTNKDDGKIVSFLEQYNLTNQYKEKYVNVFQANAPSFTMPDEDFISFEESVIESDCQEYIDLIKCCLTKSNERKITHK